VNGFSLNIIFGSVVKIKVWHIAFDYLNRSWLLFSCTSLF